MGKYTKVSRGDWIRTAAYLFLYVAALIAGAILLIPPRWPLGFMLWLILIGGGGMLLLVARHARSFAYRCTACHHEFEITFWQDLVSLNSHKGKYLRCPNCQAKGWAVVLRKTQEPI